MWKLTLGAGQYLDKNEPAVNIIHFFGPYSAKLDNILHRLESDEVIDINTAGRTHTVSIIDSSKCEGKGLSIEDKKMLNM